MPTLNWIGKDRIVNYHNEVHFRLLNERAKYSGDDNDTENLLIKGDNLEALKALLPYYYDKVKAIYIDPPYNTGNESWIYNDNVNSPEIKKWLGKVVGGEAEDLSRHDKWLCMMYPRLRLLWDLLSDDGLIFISVDDNEAHHCWLLMNDIFGERNFVADIVWNARKSVSSDAIISLNHHHILFYAKNIALLNENKGVFRLPVHKGKFSNPDSDSRGDWRADPFDAPNIRPNLTYPITNPNTGETYMPPEGRCWRTTPEEYQRLFTEGRIVFGKTGRWKPQLKSYLSEANKRGATPKTWWDDCGTTTEGTKELEKIMGSKVFDNPKPVRLIRKILQLATEKDSIILDSFAGSGTTGHAVLDLNKKDNGNRKFILVELENDIAENVTVERLKRVIRGYSYKKSNGKEIEVKGLGGGFKLFELGRPLFDRHKQIIGQPSYEDLAGYVYFTENDSAINWEKANKDDWYIGENGGVHYFTIYEGKGTSELGEEFLKIAERYDGEKIVYADTLMVEDNILDKYKIIFKQIPYEIKTF